MAIIGDLSEFTLPEVFNMVGHFAGIMRFLDTGAAGVAELHLLRGNLCALVVDQQPIRDVLQVQDRLAGLVASARGLFEFHRVPENALIFDFSVSIVSTLMRLACWTDEIAASAPHFDDPQTLYVLEEQPDASIDEDLLLFLRNAKPILENGSTAVNLAECLQLSLPRVQLCLHKLRHGGLVRQWQPDAEIIDDQAHPSISPLKVLLVEDDPLLANYLRRGLGRVLSLIAIAESVEDAQSYLNNAFQFDAIVCDYALPDGTALDLFYWLRNERACTAPFLMISGKPQEPIPNDAKFSFLAKPFEAQHLLDHLHQMAVA